MQTKLKSQKGFTLMEVLIIVFISGLLVITVLPIYNNLQISSQLRGNTSQIIQVIRTARERSSSGLNDAQHGVYFQADRYTLYQGTSYILRDAAYDREMVLGDVLKITRNLSGSGEIDDLNFSKGFSIPNKTGTITLTHEIEGSHSVSINSLGMIEE